MSDVGLVGACINQLVAICH